MRKYRNKVYTIDVQVKEWFDKINGNSYFGGIVTVNYGRKTAKTILIPFQYGYGDHYRDVAFKLLQTNKILKNVENYTSYWRYYQDNNIISRHTKHENCLKREVIAYSS